MDVERLIERLAVIADTSFLDHAAADDLREAAAALAKLQAERDEAREALRPFAEVAKAETKRAAGWSPGTYWSAPMEHFRAASRALGGGE